MDARSRLLCGQNAGFRLQHLSPPRFSLRAPGRYHVWVRAFSTGAEDNSIHLGLNGEWPESGQRITFCEGKHQWWPESRQRTREQHCGVPGMIYLDIAPAGKHAVQFSMREDGFRFDQFLLAATPGRNFAALNFVLPVNDLR